MSEAKHTLIRIKIKNQVAKRVRNYARFVILIFGVILIIPWITTPNEVFDPVIVLILILVTFAVVPLLVAYGMRIAINYLANKEFEKYISGEDL